MALLLTALLSASAADTVLQLYGDKVMRFEVENDVWTNLTDFADNANNYGGAAHTLKGLACDGRRVFVGEQSAANSRILEFDMEGNFTRVFKYLDDDVEHMAMSRDGNWLYVNIGGFDDVNACVHRYNTVTVEGGLFIPNNGTNELGVTLWDFFKHRGIAEDEYGVLWVSERENGTLYKFDADDGSYLGQVTGCGGIQGIYYHSDDKQLYCVSSGDNSYIVNVTNDTKITKNMAAANLRLGITYADGKFYSARFSEGDISAFDFENETVTLAYDIGVQYARELITLPTAPLRPKVGELLLSETGSNRVIRISFDEGNAYDVEDQYFAGGDGVAYGGTPLREPRGLAAYSNTVYIAEGIAGGRILKFSKWGSFKSVALDFSQTAYSDCVPAALAVTPDGNNLYVTDVRTLYIENDGSTWSNGMPDGYLSTNAYGRTVYKVDPKLHTASVFVDQNDMPSGYDLIEPRGVCVDDNGNVYFTSWYNDTNNLYDALGRIYKFNSAGVLQDAFTKGNLSSCYYDLECVYDPPATNAVPGPGIVTSGFGIQDIFWSPLDDLSTQPRIMDNGLWRTYLDVEVLNQQVWYTDPVFGNLYRRTGYASRVVELNGLAAPTYLTFAEVSGEEPPAQGTVILVQ